jgi:hypothetical protein
MGLDMYLTAKQYLWKSKEEEKAKRREVADLLGIKDMEAKEVSFDAIYWRKANAIHNWFIDNVQEGDDDCKEYFVETEQLQELLAECNKALETGDSETLSPMEGFFFGSAEKDEWYWDDIKRTKVELERLLNHPSVKFMDFYYRASW